MDHTLAIPELLENILLHLDIRTLLVAAQRVDTTWNLMINTSPRIQKTIFFAPDDSIPASAPVFNQLFIDTFPFCFDQLLQTSDLALPISSRSNDTSTLGAAPFPLSTHITSKAHAFSRPEASWRRMLIQQPPLRSYGVAMTATIPSLATQANTHGRPPSAAVQEILLMPSPTLCASTQGPHEALGAIISMPYLLEKCLTGPQESSQTNAATPVSGFRILWPHNSNMNAVAEATYPDEQVRGAVLRQAQGHGMVLNPVVGLTKMSPADATLQRVRDVLLGVDDMVEPEDKASGKSWRRGSDVCSDLEI
ncbi:hypothetical protein Micbo1qcDRAFT_229831 [Microdochium bolleyi]|uniref:F-box domain-containing protein n=1 Tax=Microdochium bolleyi TaxID=196109 RepID=A0A136JIV6_9PEZI|nr:hypothetical protein Micbo1qcDRAFT_229831 [Microdochium bolleyi]